jgi:hypothetical protein
VGKKSKLECKQQEVVGAGQDVNGNWLFAVSEGFCYNSRLRHELFHGIQNMQVNLFARNVGPLGIVAVKHPHTLLGGL